MWRNTGQPVRVLMLDARACLPNPDRLVYWSWTTLYIALTGFVFFSLNGCQRNERAVARAKQIECSHRYS